MRGLRGLSSDLGAYSLAPNSLQILSPTPSTHPCPEWVPHPNPHHTGLYLPIHLSGFPLGSRAGQRLSLIFASPVPWCSPRNACSLIDCQSPPGPDLPTGTTLSGPCREPESRAPRASPFHSASALFHLKHGRGGRVSRCSPGAQGLCSPPHLLLCPGPPPCAAHALGSQAWPSTWFRCCL